MSDLCNLLLGLYVSTTGSSIIMNTYLNEKSHIRSKKKSMKNLKYKKGLHSSTKTILKNIESNHLYDNIDTFLHSLIPLYNVFFTVTNIDNMYELEVYNDEVYEDIVDEANANEEITRKLNVELLKNVRDSLIVLPDNINLDDSETRLTEKETKRILKLNHMNYKKEFEKFDETE